MTPRFQLFPTFHSQIRLISSGPCQPFKIPPTFQLRLLARETRLATQIQGWKLSKSWRCHLGFNSWIQLDGSISKTTPLVSWFDLVIQTEDHRTSYNYIPNIYEGYYTTTYNILYLCKYICHITIYPTVLRDTEGCSPRPFPLHTPLAVLFARSSKASKVKAQAT
jgi:hypothetical protein